MNWSDVAEDAPRRPCILHGRADNHPCPIFAPPKVTRTWLRFDDVTCVRGNHWAGPEDDVAYVVESEGVVCIDHITADERARAVSQT